MHIQLIQGHAAKFRKTVLTDPPRFGELEVEFKKPELPKNYIKIGTRA